ncbi:integrase [Anaerocolumna cellulosilytica]|uniref:Integrase n=1 Tax=Anaerocolumna cellulosilytica TaxID=433286 RepID=A0A6S6R7S5_9FIRM|nr:VPA1269 family protein [Anaerocolumna cellulosilytica]MBB5193725.1 transposase [Anaerocolumna cellulosilytica]BCJ95058.1 integrase [Anaerocolumna cellulosilytica]
MAYDNSFKYKMITLLCEGKTFADIEREYGISSYTIRRWFRTFNSDGTFNEDELSPNEKMKLELLRKKAAKRELELRKHGTSINESFEWVLQYDNSLTEWKELAEEWIKTIVRNKGNALQALSKFFKEYLIPYEITSSVQEYLSKEYVVPDFYDILFASNKSQSGAIKSAKKLVAFVDWILEEKFSVEDDFGNKLTLAEFHNPFTKYLPDSVKNSNRNESDKNVLPYRYIKDLRNILCPPDATCFRDWKFAQEVTDSPAHGGCWFVVDESRIDKTDSDCVFRYRETSKYERDNKSLPEMVYELWFPGPSVALLTKLLLPLRTYQVRMLDSGEMDTFKYVQPVRNMHGQWVKNDSRLSKGTKNNPFERGVLRKFKDRTTQMVMTGFFINTNKTADINKDESDKGYEIPWQYEEVQYWLAKLRDWQQKYNPISKPTPWTELTATHLGATKDIKILKQMGTATFIFRNPTIPTQEHLPIATDSLKRFWYKTLAKLEESLKSNVNAEKESSLQFVNPNSKRTTYYPLHSLRVSLITAYALEGGVPMPILSKAIAGHARLVMTLYYTKAGISYVTDKMNQGEKKILENDKEVFGRFLRDAKYEQLETSVATNDPIAYQAVINAQKSGASIVISDKGICPKGCFGCDSGGTYVNDDTDKTTYGPVPGFPEQNCVRCRWFVTGPAFLPGLVNHFNVIGYNMGEIGKRVINYQNEIELIENQKFECELNGNVFTKQHELLKYEQLYAQEIQKNDKLANDYNATLRLVDKCMKIIKDTPSKDNVQLVPVGSITDVGLNINNAEHELEQLQIICNGVELYPETDASKAVLQRSQIIDLTLVNNGKKPVMFSLSDEEQLIAGNQFMRILMSRAGGLKDSIPYAVGRKKLEEIGFKNEFIDEIKSIKINEAPLFIDTGSSFNRPEHNNRIGG